MPLHSGWLTQLLPWDLGTLVLVVYLYGFSSVQMAALSCSLLPQLVAKSNALASVSGLFSS